jgi:hypothetical protein
MSLSRLAYGDAGLSRHLGPICKFFAPFPAASTQGPSLPSCPLSGSLVAVSLPISLCSVGVPQHSLWIVLERWPQLLTCSHHTKRHKVFCRKAAIVPTPFLPLSLCRGFFK